MSLLELFLLAVGLSMDAFAVSVCKGLSVHRGSMKQALTVGIWFGGFQALMPFLGYLLGITFSSLITSIDHWIAFVHASACCCNQHRRTCRRRYLRFPAGKHRSGSQLHRLHHFPALRNRFKGRQHHRRKKPLPRRICGRPCPDPDGHKDSAGAPRRDFVLKAFV